MGEIVMKGICKSFDNVKVIEDLDLTIKDGEFVVLVGASGCGKTTLLRIIAGIGPASSGQLLMDGQDITRLPPGKRNVAMVFQNYAIYPNMTVKGNIEFGLINNKVPKKERERLIKEVSESVGLTPYLNRKPNALSGGQRQRVALARAMVKKPAVFLMDEPLSNLDAKLRVQMRTELIELHKQLKTTFVYVTHDQVEAMSMADTIVLMNNGEIQQQASPEVMYHDPNNIFTAQFIGTPPMNILKMDEYWLGCRAEKIELMTKEDQDPAVVHLSGTVVTREMLGAETLYKVRLAESSQGEARELMVRLTSSDIQSGQPVHVKMAEENLYFFDEESNRIRKDRPELYEKCLKRAKEGL